MDERPSPPRGRKKVGRAPKKASVQTTSQDEMARQRGRPRLETKDQTAAERRRTQIRLAQRAYRQRKETTISGLSRRVASLEKTIEDMHQVFSGFQDEAMAGGSVALNPTLVNSLQRAAVTFAELAKNGVHQSEGEEEESPIAQPEESLEGGVGDILSSIDLRPQLHKHESDPGQRRFKAPGADAGLGTDTIWGYSPTFDNSFIPQEVPQTPQTVIQSVEDVQMQNWEPPTEEVPSNQDLQLYQVSIPEPALPPNPPAFMDQQMFWNTTFMPNELPLPRTMSHAETSFARRLLRHSLEAAIELLSSPHARKEDVDRFCRFTFCFSNRPNVLNCIKAKVRQNVRANLEFWHAPLYHLGGSGLHYPRTGLDGLSNPPENWADNGPIVPTGPMLPFTPTSTRFSNVELARMVTELEVDGEWFDSNDVEQYLRTKGVYLDSSSSVVEIQEVDDEINTQEPVPDASTSYAATSPSNTHSSITGPQSPQSDFFPTNAVIYGNEELFNTDPLGYDDVVPEIDIDSVFTRCVSGDPKEKLPGPAEMDMFPGLNFGQGPSQLQLQSRIQPQVQEPSSYFSLKKKKYVDVDKLIDNITPLSVCLGRTPGFRRADIDNALRDSTTEAMAEMVMA